MIQPITHTGSFLHEDCDSHFKPGNSQRREQGETVRQAKVSEPLYLSEQEEGLGEEGGDYANGLRGSEGRLEECVGGFRESSAGNVLSAKRRERETDTYAKRIKICPISPWYQCKITLRPTMTVWRE